MRRSCRKRQAYLLSVHCIPSWCKTCQRQFAHKQRHMHCILRRQSSTPQCLSLQIPISRIKYNWHVEITISNVTLDLLCFRYLSLNQPGEKKPFLLRLHLKIIDSPPILLICFCFKKGRIIGKRKELINNSKSTFKTGFVIENIS